MAPPSSQTVTTVAGRTVKIVKGTKSQTVNICTPDNRLGDYVITYRLPPDTEVTTDLLTELTDLTSLEEWLVARDGTPEQPGTRPAESSLVARVAAPPHDDAWVARAHEATDRAITALVNQFCKDPYLHRVEHSLHTLLHSLLTTEPDLQDVVRIGASDYSTQLVHKEWPATISQGTSDQPRPRGNFDMAVLAPDQIRSASLEQFRQGRVDAPIAVEVGLNYGLAHLEKDHHKLRHSQVQVPYLLHLSRINVTDQDATERFLCTMGSPFRTAYVHVDPTTGSRRVKHLADTHVSV